MKNKFGIINFSNNCYLNVIIQLFLSYKCTSNIISHYLDFKKNSNNNIIINPKKLLDLLKEKININTQNDSQETFIQILDKIPKLEKFFFNKLRNLYRCTRCNKIRLKEETFSTFYIYGNSLEESVKQTIMSEEFELECENCKMTTKTIKQSKILSISDILIFHNVIKNKITITENIKFNNNVYKLTGIIKHYGNESSGHYIFIDYINKIIIDDTSISSLENLSCDNIYLLFYTI